MRSDARHRLAIHGSRRYRIVRSWAGSIGLDPAAYRTHTMRRTKPTLIYRRTKNLRAVQLLLGHTKLQSTVRSLGIEVDDALEIAEQTEVTSPGWTATGGIDGRSPLQPFTPRTGAALIDPLQPVDVLKSGH